MEDRTIAPRRNFLSRGHRSLEPRWESFRPFADELDSLRVINCLLLPLPRKRIVIQKCKVSFVDRRGVHHSVEVQAATVFEAVCRASAIFKHSVVEDPTWAAEFVVEVVDKPKAFRVKTEEMKKWLARSGRSPRELVEKKRLREMLGEERTDRW
jgi:hypothetical protein